MTNTHDWRRNRKSRKRSVDDDAPQEGGRSPAWEPSVGGAASSRSSTPASTGPQYSATVKRFDADRGFGFVVLDDGVGDAFLHISTLQRAGADAVSPGMRLTVRVGPSERGPQVTEVLEVGSTDDAAPPAVVDRPAGTKPQAAEGHELHGIVKWYSGDKGFGFISPSDGGKDVFVHASALERSGMTALTEGQAVLMSVVQGKRGPEAATIRAT